MRPCPLQYRPERAAAAPARAGGSGFNGGSGFSLLELLVSILLLAMISAMVYSVLNVGIKFSRKGESQLLALEREQGVVSLLHRQVESAQYDYKHQKVEILAKDDVFRLVTRHPLLYTNLGVVLALYRYKVDEQTVYYQEKKDFYNQEYDEDYVPDFEEMLPLFTTSDEFALEYDEDAQEVVFDYGGKEYSFRPKCRNQ